MQTRLNITLPSPYFFYMEFFFLANTAVAMQVTILCAPTIICDGVMTTESKLY